MQEQPFAVFPGRLALEVDERRPDAMDLAVGFRGVVSHGDDQAKQVGAVLGQFGKDLDEVEGPLVAA